MNRENKRKTFEKGYFKTHPCRDSFTCKVCGRLVVADAAGSAHRNHCPNCLSSLHVDEEPGDRASDCGWSPSGFGSARAANGPSSTGAAAAASWIPTGLLQMTTP